MYLTLFLSHFKVRYLAECLVNVVEFPGFIRKLLSDISSHKNSLQVQPLTLQWQPLIHNLTNERECFLPFLNYWQEWTNKSTSKKEHYSEMLFSQVNVIYSLQAPFIFYTLGRHRSRWDDNIKMDFIVCRLNSTGSRWHALFYWELWMKKLKKGLFTWSTSDTDRLTYWWKIYYHNLFHDIPYFHRHTNTYVC